MIPTGAEILEPDPATMAKLDRELFNADRRMNLLPACYYDGIAPDQLRCWCHQNSRYGIPTTELIDWLKIQIAGRRALEIGAGCGDLGFHLGIPMTDSYQQVKNPETLLYMALCRQHGTKPPKDVTEQDAETAVRLRKPEVVVASWITEKFIQGKSTTGNAFGPREEYILDRCKTYIFIGNENIHGKKRILSKPHETFHFQWLVSRAKDQSKNVIYVWNS